MASADQDKQHKEAPDGAEDTQSAPENDLNGETDADNDGLSPEQEDALAKIMAEIEDRDDDAAESSGDAGNPASGDGTSPESDNDSSLNDGGLDADQEAALNKIMAEIEGQTEAEASETPPTSDQAPDAAEAKGQDTSPASDSDGDEEGDGGLDAEQTDALDKIMAEIDGGDAGAAEADEASSTAEAPSDDGASPEPDPATPGIESKPSEPGGDTEADGAAADDDDEGLSPDQEDALNKIMAEIEAKDAPSEPDHEGLSSEQESALNNIMAEIEAQGAPTESAESPESPEPEAETAPGTPEASEAPAPPAQPDAPDTPVDMAEPSPTPEPDPNQETGEPASAANPAEADAADTESLEAPPSTEDLMSQIQAAAQGTEAELNAVPDGEKKVQSSSQAAKPAEQAEGPPPPLAEVEVPAKAAKSVKAKTKKKGGQKGASKKVIKLFAWTGAAAAVVLLVAGGTYFWLSHTDGDKSTTAAFSATANLSAAPPDGAPEATVPVAEPPLADETLMELEAVKDPVPADQPLEMSPASKRLAELAKRIENHREDLLSKLGEIDDLSAYYEEGIKKITTELVGHINTRQITDYKSASKDAAVSMGLATIQRRVGYIDKLKHPRRQIQAAAEELRYLARKADILSLIAAKSSGSNLDPFSKQVDETLERISRGVSELALEDTGEAWPAIEKIWKTVWAAHLKAPKKVPPATLAMRRNREIWKEICGGDFTHIGELGALSTDAAACLAAWEGKDLFLNNLEQLSPEAAQNLSRWQGEWLVLNGLKTLSPKAARHLAAWQGRRLSLNGLTELPAAATKALAGWQGHQIEMIGLRRLAAWDNPQVTLYVRSEVRDNLAR
jgi:hypothetical protein